MITKEDASQQTPNLSPPAVSCFSLWRRRVKCVIRRLSEKPVLAGSVLGLLSLLLSAFLSSLHLPEPYELDEFSYVLMGDTFMHGRLSNPTHPLWIHFESYHIIQQPTYASKYPPGQGIMLALGRWIGGHPIVGVWISTALACVTIYWMFLAWLPARWAFVAGLLAVFHPTLMEWSQNYWGGTVALLGGALLLGAWRRIIEKVSAWDSLVLGLGAAVLAVSRPFEGMIVALLVGWTLISWNCRPQAPPWQIFLGRVVLPASIVLTFAAGALGYYNWRVTGHALRLPYKVHEETYDVAPPFLWQQARPEPAYHHQGFHGYHVDWELSLYQYQRTLPGFIHSTLLKLWLSALACLRLPLLALALPALPWVWRANAWMRWGLLFCGIFFAAVMTEVYFQFHYAAPLVGLVLVLAVQGLRRVGVWRWRNQRLGKTAVQTAVVLSGLFVVFWCVHLSRLHRNDFSQERARLLQQLRRDSEHHLVIVRYGLAHLSHEEWVYNEADIDAAKVVWAREMDAAHNRELLTYFQGRRVWLLEADARPRQLVPYP